MQAFYRDPPLGNLNAGADSRDGAIEVSKLIDTSPLHRLQGLSVGCQEWNDLREDVGVNAGVYDNPHDLTSGLVDADAFRGVGKSPKRKLEWLIRKDGCKIARTRAAEGLPGARRHRAVLQRHRRFPRRRTASAAATAKGVPVQHPAHLQGRKARRSSAPSARTGWPSARSPACAKACPTHAITFGTKAEMIAHSEKRIADLKTRGFDKAGLYNPPGVGGTHVMYVLHHADQPQLYAGLAQNPRISPIVELWKGAAKYAGLAVLGLSVVAGAVHHLLAGANRVSEEDEANADKLAKGREA